MVVVVELILQLKVILIFRILFSELRVNTRILMLACMCMYKVFIE